MPLNQPDQLGIRVQEYVRCQVRDLVLLFLMLSITELFAKYFFSGILIRRQHGADRIDKIKIFIYKAKICLTRS